MKAATIVTLTILGATFVAGASGTGSSEDPPLDEDFSYFVDLRAADCHDGAVDIRGLSVSSHDGTVTVRLSVRDFDAREVECMGVGIPRADLHHAMSFELREGGSAESRSFEVTLDKRGDQSPGWCVAVGIHLGQYSHCLKNVEFTQTGSTLRWDIPGQGVAPPHPWSSPVPYSLLANEYDGSQAAYSRFPSEYAHDLSLVDTASMGIFRT